VAKPKADPTVQVPVKMPKSLRDAARKKTKQTGITLSFIVRKALEDWTKERAAST
jgi:hypothetical protein